MIFDSGTSGNLVEGAVVAAEAAAAGADARPVGQSQGAVPSPELQHDPGQVVVSDGEVTQEADGDLLLTQE